MIIKPNHLEISLESVQSIIFLTDVEVLFHFKGTFVFLTKF